MDKKIAKFYLVLCWTFLIFKLISFPVYTKQELGYSFFDKIVHLFLFAVLTYLLVNLFKEFFKKNWPVLAASVLTSVSYSLLAEYIQTFVPGRDSSTADFSAGAAGALAAVLFVKYFSRPKLLLHICCVGCGVYISKILKKDYRVTLFFYNPNIWPESEYQKRLNEAEKVAKKFRLKLITGKYDHEGWLQKIKGHEHDPERGERCRICYQDRLQKTAHLAKRKNFRYFATTLTTSPHKDAKIISEIGKSLERKQGIKFLDKDFKKQDGFKKSVAVSRELGLYRQNYCGCEYSRNKLN